LAIAFGPILICELVNTRVLPPVAATIIGREITVPVTGEPTRLEKALARRDGRPVREEGWPGE
jgi:hypothetical protein